MSLYATTTSGHGLPEIFAHAVLQRRRGYYKKALARNAVLSCLLQTVKRLGKHKFSVYIRSLERITDRATNALCFLTAESDVAHIVTGPSEDLGLDPRQIGQINFTFRADAVLTEAFKRYFDWLWANSREITANSVALIPDLVLPEGTEEGA